MKIVQSLLEQLQAVKDIPKKYPQIKDALDKALEASRSEDSAAPSSSSSSSSTSSKHAALILAPFELCCKTKNPQLMAISLDAIGKLISYEYFATKSPEDHGLMEQVVDLIQESFTGDATDDKVLVQIFKALQAAVSCQAKGSIIHQTTLLKVIRTVYNIFLMTKKSANQALALSVLEQMMSQVFGRCRPIPPEAMADYDTFKRLDSVPEEEENMSAAQQAPVADEAPPFISPVTNSSDQPEAEVDNQLTEEQPVETIAVRLVTEIIDSAVVSSLSNEENTSTGDEVKSPTTDTESSTNQPKEHSKTATRSINSKNTEFLDAFLVFRAFCRLSIKPLPDAADQRSFALKSKILSLHLLNIIVRDYFDVVSSNCAIEGVQEATDVISPDGTNSSSADLTANTSITFVQAIKQYLCVSLSRNSVSLVPEVVERSLDIFIRLVVGMRHVLKKEVEVFFSEIFLGTLDSRSNLAITYFQKLALLKSINKICGDSQTLVEIYMNYDCDADALDNTLERIVNILSKLLSSRDIKLLQVAPALPPGVDVGLDMPSLGGMTATAAKAAAMNREDLPAEKDQSLKYRAMECMATILRSMVTWSKSYSEELAHNTETTPMGDKKPAADEDLAPSAVVAATPNPLLKQASGGDELNRFEAAKNLKRATKEGIQLFNWKYKKGISHLIQHGVIQKTPADIARFLLKTPGLDKKMIGEYLGEGEEFNIQVMHAFVDQMDFVGLNFVDALRFFLQSFRLPGEAQKIDRFMLKFAERFLRGNPGAFSNADCAYVLAYSTIMLNTDLHNPQIKKRMKKVEFIKNNRGVNDGKNLQDEFLEAIYDEIATNEIKMKDEQEAAEKKSKQRDPAKDDFENLSAKQKKEALLNASEEIASRSEAAFKGASKAKSGKGVSATPFYIARHAEHVRLMFNVAWMPVLAGISAAMQECDLADVQTASVALSAFRNSVHLASIFDLDTEKNAFVSTLTKYAYISTMADFLYRPKQVESIRSLIEIALVDGNRLKKTWLDILRCISSVERFMSSSASAGFVEPKGIIPGVATGIDSAPMLLNKNGTSNTKKMATSPNAPDGGVNELIALSAQEEAMADGVAQSLLVAMDRVFSQSSRLSGEAIVEFVHGLCEISMEEIQQSTSSSTLLTVPRMYSLTKLVEITYYNMSRIRLEWSNIWAVLGEHFNAVGCHQNQHVAFFSVDSLRQLSMKFLEKEELANFKFQKEFLRPFEHIISNNSSVIIKDMVLRCLSQMIQARGYNIKSGWKTVFAVLNKAAKQSHESIVVMAFEIAKHLQQERFVGLMVSYGTFRDFVSCLVLFAQNTAFPKVNLQSVEIINNCVPKIYQICERLNQNNNQQVLGDVVVEVSGEDPSQHLWFPILFGLYEITMSCDLETRARALKYLFDILKDHGSTFSNEFWSSIARGVLFPIFDDLRVSKADRVTASNKEDMAIWLNTTLIQALRQLIDLFTFFFELLEGSMLLGVLELIQECFSIQQENETLAKIGSSCLEQLIVGNVLKFQDVHWDLICNSIQLIFASTTADTLSDSAFVKEVMSRAEKIIGNTPSSSGMGSQRLLATVKSALSPANQAELDDQSSVSTNGNNNSNNMDSDAAFTAAKAALKAEKLSATRDLKQDFQQIIIKSVFHLMFIQTVTDILHTKTPLPVFNFVKGKHLSRILDSMEKSYYFARKFNSDMEFRVALYRIGFMKQLPNLLRQETTAVSSLLGSLLRLISDANGKLTEMPKGIQAPFNLIEDRRHCVEQFEQTVSRISSEVLTHYCGLEPAVKQRNMSAWNSVIIRILKGLGEMDDEKFSVQIRRLYRLIVDIVQSHEMDPELRKSVSVILTRVDSLWKITDQQQ